MKVIGDLESFLRRHENLPITLHYDGKRIHAATASVKQHAARLSDALEHVSEEYRRRDNGMDPMRDNGKGKAGDCAEAPAVTSTTTSTVGSFSQRLMSALAASPSAPPRPIPGQCAGCGATAAAYCVCKQATTPYPMCSCGKFIYFTVSLSPPMFRCAYGHTFSYSGPMGIGARIKYDNGDVYENTDNVNWNLVKP